MSNNVKDTLNTIVDGLNKDKDALAALDAVFQFKVHAGRFKLGETDFKEKCDKPGEEYPGSDTPVDEYITLTAKKGQPVTLKSSKKPNKDAQITFRVYEHNWNEIVYKEVDGNFVIPNPGEPGKLDPITAFMGSMMLLEGTIELAMKLPILVVLARGHKLKKQV